MRREIAELEIVPDSPETPWLRTSERITYNQCPQKWWWAYVDRLEPFTKSKALRFGSLIHLALEAYYLPGFKRGPHPADTFELEYAKELDAQGHLGKYRDEDEEWVDYLELGIEMLYAYIEKYGEDKRWKVLANERAFHMPVFDTSGKLLYTYVGVVDLVVRDRLLDFTGLVDHKTTKDDPTKKGEALVLDEQSSAYWTHGAAALRRAGLLKKVQLDGIIFNFLRKGKPDERKTDAMGRALNKDGTVSKKQPLPLFHRETVYRDEYDAYMTEKRINAQAREMRLLRQGKLELYKKPGTLHNPHCKWCEFRDMCEIHETGGDWEAIKRQGFQRSEPYSQHAIHEGETSK